MKLPAILPRKDLRGPLPVSGRMRRMKTLLAGLLLAAAATADIAPEPLLTGGNAMAPRGKDIAVEMTWEEVDITPTAATNSVVAVFRLRNTADAAVALQVGFPSYNEIPLRDFQAEVDGKPQAATEEKERLNERRFLAWMCWTMEFAAGQERTVKVSYRVEMEHIFPHSEYADLPDDLQRTIWPYRSGYVLRTGAGWKGNIGKAVIRIHYGDEVKKANVSRLLPDLGWAYDEKSRVDTLVLENFEPAGSEDGMFTWEAVKHDVVFEFSLSGATEEVEQLRKAAKERRLGWFALEYLAAWIEGGGHPRKLEELRDALEDAETPAEKKRLEEQLAEASRAYPLSERERNERLIEVLEWTLPPGGLAPGTTEAERAREFGQLEVSARLFALYRDTGSDKARPFGEQYRKTLEAILERDKAHEGAPELDGYNYRERKETLEDLKQELDALK